MASWSRIEASARERVEQAREQIAHSLRMVAENNPLAAEPQRERLIARLQAKAQFTRDEAAALARGIEAITAAEAAPAGPERIYGATIDFVGAAFLERGVSASRAVGRVAFRDGRAQGSGFLVSPRLFLTNNHVIASAGAAAPLCAEFDYELGPDDRPREATRFAFDPAAFFETDERDDLDFTLIAIGPRLSGPRRLAAFGWCPLSGAGDKHALGEVANVVQHPAGRYKEVVLRENRLVARLDTVLHYVADTEPGSSGSPVFNNEWRVIALHHWGGPWRQTTDAAGRRLPTEVNEGIRTSAIVKDLARRLPRLLGEKRALLQEALQLGESLTGPPAAPAAAEDAAPRLGPDGSLTMRVPIEISVRIPALAAPAAPALVPAAPAAEPPAGERLARPSPNYAARPGYKPRFIPGHEVPLPALSAALKRAAAPNREAESDDDPFELKYHHFSVVMHKRRRLAIYAACNVDGRTAKHIDRRTGAVSPLEADDPRLESLAEEQEAEAAESSESWEADPRLDPRHQTDQSLYDAQDVPGFPDRSAPARIARMFQRGHLVRRLDPAWGADSTALKAEADTFHFTNCAPQLGFFNQGTAGRLRLPKTGGGRLWRAVENHVLRNAVAEDSRVSCFTGCVFDEARDWAWRQGIKVPLRFWKLVVWAERGALRSLAMIADQGPLIVALNGLPEARFEAEAFDDLAEVEDFASTVVELQRLTGLGFGAAVVAGDVRRGQAPRRVRSLDEVPLALPARGKRRVR
jgi:endonuclease G